MAERTFRYAEIADSLRSEIQSGERALGTVLPSESELSERHGASRVTVRKALELLREDGLVDSRQGFGWFVGAGPVRQSLDTLDTIERQLERAGQTGERRVLQFGFVSAPADVSDALKVDDVLEVVRINYADGEPFVLVTVWCGAEAGASLSRNDVESNTFYDLLSADLGSATQTIGATAADAVAAQRLEVDEGSPLLRVRRITERTNGEGLLVSEHLYPAHRTEFHVTLTNPADAVNPTGLRLVED